MEPDVDDFDRDSELSEHEREEFESKLPVAGTDLLAEYLPFHFYPEGHWGVRFFERPMFHFFSHFYDRLRRAGLRVSPTVVIKMATYAIARHEFTHYLVELESLSLELKRNQRIYRPYWDGVYNRVYPNLTCVEETIATFWEWSNPVISGSALIRDIYRSMIKSLPWGAYKAAADIDLIEAHSKEDILSAQMNQLMPNPASHPPVWGGLPRPYAQPWTRYENAPFSMNRSLGGRLGAILNAGPIRKTIKIYHR